MLNTGNQQQTQQQQQQQHQQHHTPQQQPQHQTQQHQHHQQHQHQQQHILNLNTQNYDANLNFTTFAELCRLCSLRNGPAKIHLFEKEAEERNLIYKLRLLMPVNVSSPE